jgi:ABC-2 type transport system permease protein
MFRAIWSKSLWDYRVAILGWGIGMGLLMIVGLASATPAVLAGFASLVPLLRFLGDPYAMLTPEGYVSFRYLGAFVPLMLSFWPILAGARLVRGEEERGTLDVLLATPQPRARIMLEKVGALLLALVLIAIIFALGVMVGEAGIRHVTFVRALLEGLNLGLFAFFFGMVSLLISQFTISQGAAVGGASGVLLLSLALEITGREINGSWVQYLSPFYYYNLNRLLIPSFPDTPLAVLPLVLLSILCLILSLVLFARRDIGRPAFSWQRPQRVESKLQAVRSLSQAERAFSTRTVSSNALSLQGWSIFWWLFGILAFTAYLVAMTPAIQKPFYVIVQQTPLLQQLFFDTPTNTNAAMLGTVIFTFAPALVVAFAFTLALKWSSDLENGRLELVFSTPKSRQRVLLERFGINALVVLLACILTWLVLVVGARLLNLDVDQGRIAAACFNLFPPALITLSLVYALAGRLRYAPLLVITTIYLVLAFLEEAIEGMFQIPTWVMSLSIFHLYGNPVFLGMNWSNFFGMLAVALALIAIGLIQFCTGDIMLG